MKRKSLRQLIQQARDFALMIDRGKPKAQVLAEKKRRLERELRAKGYGRHAAMVEASRRLGSDNVER